jgi:TRAP-type C4-dicarboxylate transport system substrate-binding protein
MKIKNIPLLFALTLAIALPANHATAKKIKVKGCTVAPEGTPWEQQLKETMKHIRNDSDGAIKLKCYWGGSKGGEPECAAKVKEGKKLHLYGGTVSALSGMVPAFEAFDLPFLWSSQKEADYVLDEHAIPIVTKLLAGAGFTFYQWAENGWQSIGTKGKFIKSPADLAGLKVRTMPLEVHKITWKIFGSEVIPLDTPEVTDALESGKVDTFGQSALYTFAAGWQNYITHYTISRHLYQQGIIIYSKTWFDKIDPAMQKVLLGNAKQDTLASRKAIRALEPQLLDNFKSFGIKLYELTPKEKASFSKKAKEVRVAYEKIAGPDAKALLKVIDKGKAAFK